MKNIFHEFSVDLTKIDLSDMLMKSKWVAIVKKHPEFLEIDDEIKFWLSQKTPTFYTLLVEASKRKNRIELIINAVKCRILFEQLGYIGLKPSELHRLKSLIFDTISELVPFVEKKYSKKHLNDAVNQCVGKIGYADNKEYEVSRLFKYHGIEKEYLNWLTDVALPLQPDNQYLNDMLKLNQEIKFLKDMIHEDIEEIDFSPKDQSDYHRCACCFRFVRLKPSDRSEVAYHGYKMNMYGFNILNDSCMGAKYPPLEISTEGTFVHLSEVFSRKKIAEENIAELNAELKGFDDMDKQQSLTAVERYEKKKEINQLILKASNLVESVERYGELAYSLVERYHPDEVAQVKKFLQ